MLRSLLVSLLALAAVAPSQAGIFRKTAKPEAAVHVPALIDALRHHKDERTREAAANALRDYDAKAFPDILPALSEALTADKSVGVRVQAARSIGSIRPISPQAGYALEQAIANDKAPLVLLSARAALVKYNLLGFLGGTTDLHAQTAEPPLAALSDPAGAGETVLRPTPAPVPVTGPVKPPATKAVAPALPAPKPAPQTGEPPLLDPSKTTPALTRQPKGETPAVTIPPAPREVVMPIPTVPTPVAGSPPPLRLPPGLDKPAPANASGPLLPPPPKG